MHSAFCVLQRLVRPDSAGILCSSVRVGLPVCPGLPLPVFEGLPMHPVSNCMQLIGKGLPVCPGFPFSSSQASGSTRFPHACCCAVWASRAVRASSTCPFSRIAIQPADNAVLYVWGFWCLRTPRFPFSNASGWTRVTSACSSLARASRCGRASRLCPRRPPGVPGFHMHAAVCCGPPGLSGPPSPGSSREFRFSLHS